MIRKSTFLLCCILLILFISSCATEQVIIDISSVGSYQPVRYSLIFIIHGDGSYLYHDSDGNPYNADEDVLQQALGVAENCAQCEIFIFHQKKKSRFLGIIPLKDGEFYYYRNTVLLDRRVYYRKVDDGAFKGEIELVRSRPDRSYGQERELMTFFLYFGHQIPEWSQQTGLNIQDFSEGIEEFRNIYSPIGDKLDLVVLSTCYSGTIGVISSLLPHSHYIIASPDILHLSHINIGIFKQLDRSTDMYQFAKATAQMAFDKLKEKTKTMITIALYDTMEVASYLRGAAEPYQATVDSVIKSGDGALVEFYDCLDDSDRDMGLSDRGVDMFYKAPRFGRQKNKANHSGWECVRIKKTD
jgi:hypothetical protein